MPLGTDTFARAEMLAALLAEPPPRRVPAELRRAASGQGPSWFFGLFGLLFGGFGLFMAGMLFPWKFYEDWQLDGAPLVTGRVLAVAPTHLSINKQRVYQYDYEFTPPGAGRSRDVCYTTGRWWTPGAAVGVRYRAGPPALSCIDGARRTEGSLASAFVLIFPAVGGSLVAWVVVGRRRLRFLLERGQVGEALVTLLEPTMTRINNHVLYRITLQRADATGDTPMLLRQYQPAQVELARQRLASKQPVFVLYDPAHPQRALLPESLL